MAIINKQKFLAELGRLLTFMYDEDRQTALTMYGRMFDETADEAGLMELLVSPTRQAVVLARSYDAKARKLQIENEDADSAPAFIYMIDNIAKQAAELGVKEAAVAEGQFSIFDEVYELPEVDDKAEEMPVAEKAVALPVEDEETERSSVDETADALDAFLADFTIENGELVSVKAEEKPAEPVEEVPQTAEPVAEAVPEVKESKIQEQEPKAAPAEYRLKVNILLLILYIFLAIPLGLIGIALLLLPTVFFLTMSIGCAYAALFVIPMSFSAFSIIADTLAVFGGGLALAGLALLFVWLFIWFLGGAIGGYIRGLCRLGRKLCCKEVAVQ